MSLLEAFHAATRFGFGVKGDELAHIASDPRGWLLEQIKSPIIPPLLDRDFGGSQLMIDLTNAAKSKDKEARKAAQRNLKAGYLEMVGSRLIAQASAQQPFTERMVWFWTNHFTISKQKKIIFALPLKYEREVVRPHMTGYFKDMLVAAERHPAMLYYLDNIASVGPNTPRARKHKMGLNENLAREILELHTLGANGGYTQQDVTEFAKVITGWGVDKKRQNEEIVYLFDAKSHEPGDKTILGQVIHEEGEKEGLRVLEMLAHHPSTAIFIATKLVKHFVADTPPARAVDELAKVFMQTQGHLPSIMEALVNLPGVWEKPLSKFKNPYEYIASVLRVTDMQVKPKQATNMLSALHFDAFDAGSPAGFDDFQEAWLTPDAIMKRIEFAYETGFKMASKDSPIALAKRIFPEVLSAQTTHTIEGAETDSEGYALLLASPEFMRR